MYGSCISHTGALGGSPRAAREEKVVFLHRRQGTMASRRVHLVRSKRHGVRRGSNKKGVGSPKSPGGAILFASPPKAARPTRCRLVQASSPGKRPRWPRPEKIQPQRPAKPMSCQPRFAQPSAAKQQNDERRQGLPAQSHYLSRSLST
jgi:hypothetical protein